MQQQAQYSKHILQIYRQLTGPHWLKLALGQNTWKSGRLIAFYQPSRFITETLSSETNGYLFWLWKNFYDIQIFTWWNVKTAFHENCRCFFFALESKFRGYFILILVQLACFFSFLGRGKNQPNQFLKGTILSLLILNCPMLLFFVLVNLFIEISALYFNPVTKSI